MRWRRSTDHDLDERELRALLQLRMSSTLSEARLNELLPHRPPTELVEQYCDVNIDPRVERRIELAMHELQQADVRILLIGDAAYPASLAPLGELRPPVLFCRGNLALFESKTIAIVGTRRSTEYGNETAEMLAHDLACRGISVISGLALGIDTFAHRGALAAGGNTIAVLGCGIDVYYPHRNQQLQERIAAEGLLISEFAPGSPAVKHHFLQRNRLIALLARAVVVVEAGSRSGTRNTVKWALDYSVDVFAVPGPIGREASIGTNELIQDGAAMITSSRDLLEQLPWRFNSEEGTAGEEPVPAQLNGAQARIYKLLGPVAIQIDKIARAANMDTRAALVLLAQMEMEGLVGQLPGKNFVRRPARKPAASSGQGGR